MDQIEELAAAYGLSPFEVARWPWKKFESVWQSFEKRQRRKVKVEALLRGVDPFGGAGGATMPGPQPVASPIRQYGDWEEAVARKPKTWYEAEDHGLRQPNDKDNWDIPEMEVNRLALTFPGMVVVKGT